MTDGKTIIVCLLFLLCYNSQVAAQQYDKVWALGSPVTTMAFENDSVVLGYLQDSSSLSFNTIGSICNRDGNFLFYSNGINVYNRYGQTMPNGDSLSYPSEYYYEVTYQGMPSREGLVILPKPNDTNLYYIFHYTPTDTLLASSGSESLNLYYSIVDMRMDSGRGDVVSKNNPIIQGELLSASRLTACRHANGRDWWIVKNAWYQNRYYVFLLTPDSLEGPFIQQIGPTYGVGGDLASYSTFSLDGSKYASVTAVSHVVVMDFDRCTGLFSNPINFYNNNASDPVNHPNSGGGSLAFSPSGHFLYVDIPTELNQYDLWSTQVHDSIRIKTDTAEAYQMNILQLAPNGKIYISCWNGGSYKIHVINAPDSLGSVCDFQLLGQQVLSVNSQSLPYFPNFRLGALNGSGCDTIPNGNQTTESPGLKIEPNPASNIVTIFYPPNGGYDCSIDLYDNLGQLVFSKKDGVNTDRASIDLSAFPDGIYIVRVTANNAAVLSSKLVLSR